MCLAGAGIASWSLSRGVRFEPFLKATRKRSLRNYFLHVSVCPWGGVSQHALQVSRPTPRGEVERSGLGVSRSTLGWGGLQAHQAHTLEGGLQAHTQGVSQHALRQTPPSPTDSYCRGQYASYWNAFLFVTDFAENLDSIDQNRSTTLPCWTVYYHSRQMAQNVNVSRCASSTCVCL